MYGTGFISKSYNLGGCNIFSNGNKLIYKPHSIISVRGPKTRNKLIQFGIECPKIYGDPLILFPCFYIPDYSKIKKKKKKGVVGIIPHYKDQKSINVGNLKNALTNKGYGVKIINIMTGNNYKQFIDKINECDYIIASSLHAMIMGLVYKKKTIFIQFSNMVHGDKFKFEDFLESVDIKYVNKNVYNEDVLKNVINIDYNKLSYMGRKLLSVCPFIEQKKKNKLIKIYRKFYENMI